MTENEKIRHTIKKILVIVAVIIGGAVTLLIYHSHEKWLDELSEINSNTGYGKGIIIYIWDHRDRRIKIKYKIDNKIFVAINDWDNNPRNLAMGDSICFKYSIKHPQYVVTELEYEYTDPKLNRFSIF